MNGLTKVKIALVYARNGVRDDIGMHFRSSYVNQSYTLTGDGHIDFVVPFVDARRYTSTSTDMGEFAIIVLSAPYSTAGVGNSSFAYFFITKRFNNDLELYGPRPDGYKYESDIMAVNPPQTLSLQPLSHVKDLMLVGQKPNNATCTKYPFYYKITCDRMYMENLFALRRSAYRYHIYTTNNDPLFISAGVYEAGDDTKPFNSYIPYVPGNSQNGITVEVPRYNSKNFEVNHSSMDNNAYDLYIRRQPSMDGTSIYISQSVSDEAIYTWFQIPKLSVITAGVQEYPQQIILAPSE